MNPSLSAFMHRLIDYAGLFPPSGLDMDTAISNFLSYRKSDAAPVLASFVIPAARLIELEQLTDEFAEQSPVPFSVITGKCDDSESCLAQVEKGLKQCRRFLDTHSGNTAIPVLEIKLPDDDPDEQELGKLCSSIRKAADAALNAPADIYFEPVRNQFWRARIDSLTNVLQHMPPGKGAKNGLKLRCGGVEAHMFPTIDQLAAGLHACLKRGVPFKGTAGLHHPVRHFNDGVETKMHGFLNLFGAAVLGTVHKWNESEIARMLLDENAENFIFNASGFSWKEYSATHAQIRSVRTAQAASYGSCSLIEPLEDLQQLGLYSLPAGLVE